VSRGIPAFDPSQVEGSTCEPDPPMLYKRDPTYSTVQAKETRTTHPVPAAVSPTAKDAMANLSIRMLQYKPPIIPTPARPLPLPSLRPVLAKLNQMYKTAYSRKRSTIVLETWDVLRLPAPEPAVAYGAFLLSVPLSIPASGLAQAPMMVRPQDYYVMSMGQQYPGYVSQEVPGYYGQYQYYPTGMSMLRAPLYPTYATTLEGYISGESKRWGQP
jgi:hypothetical protein